eukprot:3314644-Amphidinium_carterae.2
MQICFVVANVQSPLIGLPGLNDNITIIHTGDKPYIDQFGYNEQLNLLGQHLHIVVSALPGFHKVWHKPNEIQFDQVDNEPAMLQLAQGAAKELKIPRRHSS